jgi:dTDP-4-dehydrorhamnose reductase
MNILISGTSSGLGKYLSRNIHCTKFKRNKNRLKFFKKKWDVIIHCGFYAGNDKNKLKKNLYWSKTLSNLESKKYIFISSAIVLEKIQNSYGIAKIKSENLFIKKKNFLILRLGSIIGFPMRKNTIYKILHLKNPQTNISADSLYSFVSYSEILRFIEISIKKNLNGIFNFFRTDLVKLKDVALQLKKKVIFGNIYFKCTTGDNSKILKYINLNKKSSIDILKKYIKYRN